MSADRTGNSAGLRAHPPPFIARVIGEKCVGQHSRACDGREGGQQRPIERRKAAVLPPVIHEIGANKALITNEGGRDFRIAAGELIWSAMLHRFVRLHDDDVLGEPIALRRNLAGDLQRPVAQPIHNHKMAGLRQRLDTGKQSLFVAGNLRRQGMVHVEPPGGMASPVDRAQLRNDRLSLLEGAFDYVELRPLPLLDVEVLAGDHGFCPQGDLPEAKEPGEYLPCIMRGDQKKRDGHQESQDHDQLEGHHSLEHVIDLAAEN